MSTDRFQAIRQRVQRVLDQAVSAGEPEAKSDLACLACVLTSAMIEVACRELVARYAGSRAAPTVCSYVQNKLHYFQNAKADDIDKLLRAFSPPLADKYSETIGEEGIDALNSVVNKKNELVHGKGAGIGLDTMQRYHKDVVAALDALRKLLTDPSTA